MTADEIEREIKWLREHIGDKPFGLDVLIPASVPPSGSKAELREQIPPSYWEFVESIKRDGNIPAPKPQSAEEIRVERPSQTQETARRQLEVILEERVPVLASGLGSPAFILDEAHQRGMKVFGLIGNVRQARREAEAGVDFIVAQGTDSGGHTGEIGTFSLVPQVVNAVKPTPVICAGGVGNGSQLAAAICLGAVGVWTGTIWLTVRESDTDLIVKEKILAATERDTIRSRSSSGKPIRQLQTRWTEVWDAPDAPPPLPMPLQGILVSDVLTAVRENRIADFMGSPAGQVVGMIDEMKPAAQVIFDMVDEAQEVLETLSGVSEVN
jgi:NAD(P)H-dependent flavin oxidoreductase YrpB (nitropropane dioxygenase family)